VRVVIGLDISRQVYFNKDTVTQLMGREKKRKGFISRCS
jgi:hypothetical protein